MQTTVAHRFATLQNGTTIDLEFVAIVGPVYKETPEHAHARKEAMMPSHDNMYNITLTNGKTARWCNAVTPRAELVDLWCAGHQAVNQETTKTN